MNARRTLRAFGVGLGLLGAPAWAQTPPAPATAPAMTASDAPAEAVPPAAPVPMVRAVTLQAGTGVLLRLPVPAATVMSAQPAIARVQPASPTSLFLMAVSAGRTTLIATNDAGLPIAQYDVTVTPPPGPPPGAMPPRPPDMMPIVAGPPPGGPAAPVAVTPELAAKIRDAIAATVAGAADLGVTPNGHTILLRGSVPSAAAAAQAEAIAHGFLADTTHIIDELAVIGRLQVNVRVRFAEISRQITRELGVNWQVLGNTSGWRLGLLAGAAASGAINALSPVGLTALGNVPYGQMGTGYSGSNGSVDGLIDALAADQLITILAEPNLTALSGETASFLAGGEFPVPMAAASMGGVPQITVQFQQYGVSLAVVPTVLADNRLNLRIRPEVSELTTTGAVSLPLGVGAGSLTIPALTVRRAETTIELGSGQSFAIAGLLQKTTTDITKALPGIGEMPVLGGLFKSNSFQRGETELVIVVTPYIVRPVARPQMLATPADSFTPATDLDRVLLGRQLGTGASGRPLDAGFILK